MMYDFSKTFFSSKRAEAFKAELLAQGIEAMIVSENVFDQKLSESGVNSKLSELAERFGNAAFSEARSISRARGARLYFSTIGEGSPKSEPPSS